MATDWRERITVEAEARGEGPDAVAELAFLQAQSSWPPTSSCSADSAA